jgi:uncharacterized protein YecE (DUF72 family)
MRWKAGVALAIIDGDKQALRGDVTADFVYARLQRNDTAAPEGYGSSALDEWATRANAWAAGMKAQNLDLSAPAPRPKAPARDVFLYFISGDKIRAPDAAMAFLQRIETARK